MANFTAIKNTMKGGEVFYGVKNTNGEYMDALSVSETEVNAFVDFINAVDDVDMIHIVELFENFCYNEEDNETN